MDNDNDNKEYDIIDNKEVDTQTKDDDNIVIVQNNENPNHNIFKQIYSYLSDGESDKSFSIASEDSQDLNTDQEYGSEGE